MQSKIKDVTEVQKQGYPCLKVFRSSGGDTTYDKVVLFIAQGAGIVVHAFGNCNRDGNYFKVGDYSSDWYEEDFEPFYGTVELSN